MNTIYDELKPRSKTGYENMGNYTVFLLVYSSRVAKEVAAYMDKVWKLKIQECNYVNEKIITLKIKYDYMSYRVVCYNIGIVCFRKIINNFRCI